MKVANTVQRSKPPLSAAASWDGFPWPGSKGVLCGWPSTFVHVLVLTVEVEKREFFLERCLFTLS